MNEETLFQEAISRPSEQRAAFLEEACAGQPDLREAVNALLAAHEKSSNILDKPPVELGETVDSASVEAGEAETGEYKPEPVDESLFVAATNEYRPNLEPGAVISERFTLQEKIGEGGMGEVWVAKQTEPVQRRVALKLIKTGMDSKAVLARFEQERQALALMDHPNIAKVLDAGMTATGQPFFVMELVDGLPLTKFCDDTKLSLQERLKLFLPICQAVQHAHQKGIVHRDLKPANILITMIDGKPVPKVIDFGVAKATEGKLTEESMATQFGAVVGTLEYMSPEQAGFSGEDIDTRADIYSLGVILYELLTGLRPIDKARLQKAALTEMIRIIREEDPSKPSTRLSTDDSLPSLAAVRQIEPKKLTAMLRRELDWIVMKCLEKQRDRRYETANGLARDLQRYLSDEPVEARPASKGYRLRKFFKRNKGPVLAACLVLAALLVGIVGTTVGLIRAEAGEKLAGERLVQVEAEKKKAEEEKAVAVAVKDFLKDDLLTQADVTKQANALAASGRSAEAKQNPTIRELLDRAAEELAEEKIEAKFPNQPQLQAEILHTVGVTYIGVAEYERAIELLKRSHALNKQHRDPDHSETLETMDDLAAAYTKAGKLKLALPLFKETLELRNAKLGLKDPATLQTMSNLAAAYQASGDLRQAQLLFEKTLKLQQATLGHNDRVTLVTMQNLCAVLYMNKDFSGFLSLAEKTFELRKAKLGPDHPDTLRTMNSLAGAYMATRQTDRALSLWEETIKLLEAKFGLDHPTTLITMYNLALAYSNVATKRHLTVPLFEKTFKLQKAKLGLEHPDTFRTLKVLAESYRRLRKPPEESIPLLEDFLKVQRKKNGNDHSETLQTLTHLGVNYMLAREYKKAIPLLEEAHRASRKDPRLRWVGRPLVEAYMKTGEDAKLGNMLLEQLPDARRALPKDSPQLAGLLAQIGTGLLAQKKWTEAEPLIRECVSIREKSQPDAWTTFNAQSMLGGAQLGQKKYAEAEPLLIAGYEGMKKQEAVIPPLGKPRLREALERLVQFYEKTGKKDESAKWRKELKASKPAPMNVKKK